MKIRLLVRTPDGVAVTFEHAGPVVHVGRDPACELHLQGEACQVVSRRHVRVALSPGGATVADAGSSNGTLLNGRPLPGPAPLAVGDEVQLGQTGVTLRVLALDLPTPARLPVALLVGGGVALVALVAVGLWLASAGRRPAEPTPEPGPQASRPTPEPPAPPPMPARVEPPVPVAVPPPVVGLGKCVALPGEPAGVLLSREGEASPWVRLKPEERVLPGRPLVSLPGCRNVVALDGGLRVALWGNLPELSAFPPVLESAVVLDAPAAGVDLDLTLQRGRVVLANVRDGGAATVRLRFLGEEWRLTLPAGRENEAAVELWELPPGPGMSDAKPADWCLGVFSRRGGLTVRTATRSIDVPGPGRLVWVGAAGTPFPPEGLPEPPVWWTALPDPARTANPALAAALRASADWAGRLAGTPDVVAALRAPTDDPAARGLAVLHLAALDEVGPLVQLADTPHAEVRAAAATALRRWLRRSDQNGPAMQRVLGAVRKESPEKAKRIADLLGVSAG